MALRWQGYLNKKDWKLSREKLYSIKFKVVLCKLLHQKTCSTSGRKWKMLFAVIAEWNLMQFSAEMFPAALLKLVCAANPVKYLFINFSALEIK